MTQSNIDDGWIDEDDVPTVRRLIIPELYDNEQTPTVQHPVSDSILAMLVRDALTEDT